MAKYKKMMPPRNTVIRGQDHLLAYITPEEAALLKARGGTGEAGPMGIPSYPEPGMGAGSDDVGTAGDGMGEGQGGNGAGGGGGGGKDNSNDNDNSNDSGNDGGWDGDFEVNTNTPVGSEPDDPFAGEEGDNFSSGNYGNDPGSDPGDFEVNTNTPKGSEPDDPFAGEEGDDFSDPNQNYGNDPGIDLGDFEVNTNTPAGSEPPDDTDSVEVAQDQQNMGIDIFDSIDDFNQQDARDRAIRDAFVTDTSGNPIGTRSGYVTQGRATDAELSAGYKALGLPDPNSDLASADVEASYGVPVNAIETVSSGVPSTANKSGLLGFDYDLLKSNIDKAIEARKGMPTQVSPLATSPFNAQNQAAASIDPFSAPSSNVVPDFSPTPADQLEAVYGIDLDALNAAVDDPTAAMGARGPTATDAKAGIGYDPVTDLPYGLEFTTHPQTGAQITTNLAGLTEKQKANQPLSMDIAQFMGSSPYGYELDPATGNPIGQVGTTPFGMLGSLSNLAQTLIMGKPTSVQDLIERGAYTGMTGQDGGDDIFGGGGDDNILLASAAEEVAPEEVAPESTDPNQIGGINTPADPLAPAGPVLVPSTRTSTPFSGQMPVGYGTPQTGQINPYALSEMKRYEQLLRQLGQQKSPIGLAQGGSVLDAAAGRFLESLTAA